MNWVRGELAPLKEQAERDQWVAHGIKWAFVTLTFSIIGAYLVPYVLNMLLVKAEMEPVATGFAGFLIGGALVNLERFGRMWFVPVLAMVAYLLFEIQVFEAAKLAFDGVLAGALD